MTQKVLLGDEAVALAATHAGLTAAYSYPGTPATEIMEALQHHADELGRPVAAWCANEKTAYEAALGVSFAGKRSLVSMKHVGLNVAADPFINSAIVSVHGGLVVVVADDPGMHSSQNDQDTRVYADFARTLCLERTFHKLDKRIEVPLDRIQEGCLLNEIADLEQIVSDKGRYDLINSRTIENQGVFTSNCFTSTTGPFINNFVCTYNRSWGED